MYEVDVRNELTGEVEKVRLSCACSQDAQVNALLQLFKHQGWRKAVAAPPELALAYSESE